MTRHNIYSVLYNNIFGFALKYLQLCNLYCGRKGDGGHTQRVGAPYSKYRGDGGFVGFDGVVVLAFVQEVFRIHTMERESNVVAVV